MTYKIILADDHQFLLDGLKAALADVESLEIVATALNGFNLIDAVVEHRPHLVVLDLNMPGYDGLQCLQKIKSGFSGIKVLILTSYFQPDLVEQVKKLDADGFLNKNTSAQELKETIERILAGNKHFPAVNMVVSLPEDSYFFDSFLKKYQITKREIGIIRLICMEKSTKEIASELFLSELTISTHRRNILRKLELKNVAGLINFAKQNMLL